MDVDGLKSWVKFFRENGNFTIECSYRCSSIDLDPYDTISIQKIHAWQTSEGRSRGIVYYEILLVVIMFNDVFMSLLYMNVLLPCVLCAPIYIIVDGLKTILEEELGFTAHRRRLHYLAPMRK